MRADLFWRPMNTQWSLDTASYASDTIKVPSNATLCEILGIARAQEAAGKGTHKTGVNEVQTDKGIYTSLKDTRMDPSTTRKMKNIIYRTWEELMDLEDFYETYSGPYSGESTGNGHDEKGNYFSSWEQEQRYWFKTLDQIPKESSTALEKCKDFFSLKPQDYKRRFKSGSCCRG